MMAKTTYSASGEIKFLGIGRFRLMLIDHRGNYTFRRVDALGSAFANPLGNGAVIFDYEGWVKIRGKRLYIARERRMGSGMMIHIEKP